MALTSIDNFLEVADYSATSPRTMFNSSGTLGFAPHNLILASEDFSDSNWTKTDTTVTSNAAAAPDGTITADKISHTSTSAFITQNAVVVGGTVYGAGLFLKYIDHQWVSVTIDGTTSWVDIQNVVIGTDNLTDTSVTLLNDDWVHIATSYSSGDTTGTFTIALAAGDGLTAETSGTSAYIWGAHLYENGLGGMFDVPEDQRALPALKKYLPNKAVETGTNLVSNGTFDSNTNGWTDIDTSTFSVTSGQVTVVNNGSVYGKAYQSIDTVVGETYRVSIEVVSTDDFARINVEDSTPTSGSMASTYLNTTDAGVYTFHFTATASTTYLSFGLRNQSNATGTFDNITVTKVDRDPTAARFLPRRNAHEYIDGAWVKGLKVESEARTNLVTEALDFSTWAASNITVTDSDATGPDGQTSASHLEATGSTAFSNINYSVTLSTSTEYTLSVYIKGDTSTQTRLRLYDSTGAATEGEVYVDWTAGVPSTNSSTGASNINYELVGGGWYRASFAATSDGTNTAHGFYVYPDSSGANGNIYIYGAQLEAGSTPSSVIPTYGATRTRTAETFTQKEDKIIWPNTTYVDGTELVTNGTFDTDTDWTKQAGWSIGSGVASVDSSAAGTTILTSTGMTVTSGSTYEVTYTINSVTGSGIRASLGGYAEPAYNTSAGTYSFVVTATSTTGLTMTAANADTVGDIDNISVKEINPRALCVVMHGYMTYADEGAFGVTRFFQMQEDGNNYIDVLLDTAGGDTGEVWVRQVSNGTSDTTVSATDTYSPGINVPFKIASRHLDNAVQGAADGTATTENTTPPGLPDLSSTQTEWFYDFNGLITFAGKGQESSADKLDSTNGPSTLTTATGGNYP